MTLALIDTNLTRQLQQTLPERAPSFFFLDIPNAQADAFEDFLKAQRAEAKIERVPMMRGRLVSLRGVPASQVKAEEDISWVLEGDRGITYAKAAPDGALAGLERGVRRGRPLVSFDQRIAEGLGLKIAYEIVVNVLGRNITAAITSAPRGMALHGHQLRHGVLAQHLRGGAVHASRHRHLSERLGCGDRCPHPAQRRPGSVLMVTSVRVKDALEAVNDVVSQLVMAIRGASSIALIASLLVLAGALAAGHRARLYDAVVLKTLGPPVPLLLRPSPNGFWRGDGCLRPPGRNLRGVFHHHAGHEFGFTPDLSGSLASGLAVLVAVGLGLVGTWRILSQNRQCI